MAVQYLLESYTLDDACTKHSYALYKIETSTGTTYQNEVSGPFKILAELSLSSNYNLSEISALTCTYTPFLKDDGFKYIFAFFNYDNDKLLDFNSDEEAMLWFELNYNMNM